MTKVPWKAIIVFSLSIVIIVFIKGALGYRGYTGLCCSIDDNYDKRTKDGYFSIEYFACIANTTKRYSGDKDNNYKIVYYKLNDIFQADYYRNDTLQKTVTSQHDITINLDNYDSRIVLEKLGGWNFTERDCLDPEVEGGFIIIIYLFTLAIFIFLTIPASISLFRWLKKREDEKNNQRWEVHRKEEL